MRDDRQAQDAGELPGAPGIETATLGPCLDMDGASAPEIRGEAIAGYVIIRRLGCGGMGVVYEALQKSTKRLLALKVMRDGPFADPKAKLRFQREVELAAGLNHPNIVTVYDSGVSGGYCYLAMQRVDGLPLDRYVSEHKLDAQAVLRLMEKICLAVDHAHQRGIVHRDLKPNNILIDAAGEPHVLDFGLAKSLSGGVRQDEPSLSAPGARIGTLRYMAPEQASGAGDQVGVRTDVYALGLILYELLTHSFPYPSALEQSEILRHIIETQPKGFSTHGLRLNRDIETIALKCLDKHLERRYESAAALAADIRRYLAGEPIRARRSSFVYRARRGMARAVTNHRRLALLLAVAAAAGFAEYGGYALIYQTPLHDWVVQSILPGGTSIVSDDLFSDTRLVAFSDATDFESLAGRLGLSGVTREVFTWRRVHGALMKLLAETPPKVVVFDIDFAGERPGYDNDFVGGVEALRAEHVDVVIGVQRLDEDAKPVISDSLVGHVKWGWMQAILEGNKPWMVAAYLRREPMDYMPSLSLRAVSAARQPETDISIDWPFWCDPKQVRVRYWEDREKGRYKLLSSLCDVQEKMAIEKDEAVLKKGDEVGYRQIDLPSLDCLRDRTIEYQDVFAAGLERRREWFENCVVMVGGTASMFVSDKHVRPDGKQSWGCEAQTVATAMLLKDVTLVRPWFWGEVLINVVGAFVGAMLGSWLGRRPVLLAFSVVAMSIAAFGLSLAAYRLFGSLASPVAPMIAALVGIVLAMVIDRCGRQRTPGMAVYAPQW